MNEKAFKKWAESHGVDIYFYRNTIRESSGVYSVTVPEIGLHWSGDATDANEARILAVENYEMEHKKNPKLAKRRITGKPERYYLFDVLSDYAVELVDGKSDFGTLEHAKKRAKKDNKGVVIFWSKKTKLPGESWWGFNVHGEMINVIATRKTNPVIKKRPAHEKGFIIEDKSKRTCAQMHKQIKGFMEHARPGQIYECGACHKQFTKAGKNPVKKTTAKQWYRFGWNDARGGAVGNAPKNATHRKYYREGFKDYPSKDKYKKNPAAEIDELILFTENEGKLHNQFLSIMKNLSRKYKKGTYNPVLAAKLWKYWIDEGVIEYNVQFGSGKRTLRQSMFTVDDRKKAAVLIEAQQRGDVATGEYLLINPKGRKKMAKKRRSAKQLANDKRLGRMAKARAKKKRGGRSKVTKRKVTKRRANPKRTTRAKSHLQIVFKCKGNAIYFLTLRGAKLGWTLTKGDAIFFSTKAQARHTAQNVTIPNDWSLAIAPSNLPAAGLVADCKRQVAGKA